MGYKKMEIERFVPFYAQEVIPVEELLELVDGKRSAVVVKKFLSEEVCEAITENFVSHERSELRRDKVPGNYIGAYHYNKPLDVYFTEVEMSLAPLEKLFSNTVDPVYRVQRFVTRIFESYGFSCRVAVHEGRPAGKAVARKWNDKGTYSLKPHDDIAQLTTTMQRGFEIQEVKKYNIIGANICINNSVRNGGELVVWNCMTDDEERQMLNIPETGYPYPLDYLVPFDRTEIIIEKGDLYFLNSNLVHAVNNQVVNERITVSFFMGKSDEETVVFWT